MKFALDVKRWFGGMFIATVAWLLDEYGLKIEIVGRCAVVVDKEAAGLRSNRRYPGDPVQDWKRARLVLEEVKDLNEIYRDVRMVRLLGARDVLAPMLSALWLSSGSHAGAENDDPSGDDVVTSRMSFWWTLACPRAVVKA